MEIQIKNKVMTRNKYNLIEDYLRNKTEYFWGDMPFKEFQKNYKRVHDIDTKSDGDLDKAIRLATTQSNRITVENKALHRYYVAKYEGFVEVSEVFFERAYELGEVNKSDFREYRMKKLLG